MNRKTVAGANCIGAVLLLVGLALPWARASGATKWEMPAGEAERKSPIVAGEKSLAAGKSVYAKNCLPCHGPSGKGDGPKGVDIKPQPADLRTVAADSDGALYWKITSGRRPMPAFKKLLSDEERWQVVSYVHTFGTATPAKVAEQNASTPASARQGPDEASGDDERSKKPLVAATAGTTAAATTAATAATADEKPPAEGKAIYTKHCASCHGDSGKGDGPKAANLDPKPPDLTSADTAAESDAALYRRITAGKKPMPSFEKVLSEEQRRQVLKYVRSFSPQNQRQAPSGAPAATSKAASAPAGTSRPAANRSAEPGDGPARVGNPPAQSHPESGWRHLVRWAGHFHPPLTSFPIALLLGAALAEAIRLMGGADWLKDGSRWCVIVGALGALLAAPLGWAFAIDHARSRLLEIHRWLGTAAGGGAVAILVLSELGRRRGRTWLALFRIALFAAVPLVVATGYFGGAMIYGTHAYRWSDTQPQEGDAGQGLGSHTADGGGR